MIFQHIGYSMKFPLFNDVDNSSWPWNRSYRWASWHTASI